MTEREVLTDEIRNTKRNYRFMFVKVDGDWMDIDDAFEEYGTDFETEDEFTVWVEAENWRDAKEKLIIAAKVKEK